MSSERITGSKAEPEGTTPVLTLEGGRATIRLNRPRHHNRLEQADIRALGRILEDIEERAEIRVVVLTGTGASFSAGYDLTAVASAGNGGEDARDGEADLEALTEQLEALRQPTICALNGSVYGSATDVALACDFRIGVTGMRLSMPAARLGFHYYPAGLRRYVARLGLGPAKRLFLTAEPMEAAEMLRIGYLDALVEPAALAARVDALALSLAGNAPVAVQGMKQALNQCARGTLDEASARTAFRASLTSTDAAEGVAAWRERRAPVFKGE